MDHAGATRRTDSRAATSQASRRGLLAFAGLVETVSCRADESERFGCLRGQDAKLLVE